MKYQNSTADALRLIRYLHNKPEHLKAALNAIGEPYPSFLNVHEAEVEVDVEPSAPEVLNLEEPAKSKLQEVFSFNTILVERNERKNNSEKPLEQINDAPILKPKKQEKKNEIELTSCLFDAKHFAKKIVSQLAHQKPTKKVDQKKLVELKVKKSDIEHIPLVSRLQTLHEVILITDKCLDNAPIHRDIDTISQELMRLLGRDYLIKIIEINSIDNPIEWQQWRIDPISDFIRHRDVLPKISPNQSVVFIFDPSKLERHPWQNWLRQIQASVPTSTYVSTRLEYIPKGWVSLEPQTSYQQPEINQDAFKLILSCLATTPFRFSLAMIRELRRTLTQGSVSVEFDIMSYSELDWVEHEQIGWWLYPSEAAFSHFKQLSPEQQQEAATIIEKHLPAFEEERYLISEHRLLLANSSTNWKDNNRREFNQAEEFIFSNIKAVSGQSYNEDVFDYFYNSGMRFQHIKAHVPKAMLQAYAVVNYQIDEHKMSNAPLPNMDTGLYFKLQNKQNTQPVFPLKLVQHKEGVQLLALDKLNNTTPNGIADLLPTSHAVVQQSGKQHHIKPNEPFTPNAWPFTLETPEQTLTLNQISSEQLYWAESVIVDERGLIAETEFVTVHWPSKITPKEQKTGHYLNAQLEIKPEAPEFIKQFQLTLDKYGLKLTINLNLQSKPVEFSLRYIPPSSFLMGSPQDEEGRFEYEVLHTRTIKHGFWLADTTVTQALWQAVMGENPSHFKDKKDALQLPVERVNWQDCQSFCLKINKLIPALDLTLPEEAQWEYACRAGSQTTYWWGGHISEQYANYNKNNKGTVNVKEYSPNSMGLYQMHGNVYEWCQNIWIQDLSMLKSLPLPERRWFRNRENFTLRGGSWFTPPRFCRSSNRAFYDQSYTDDSIGLRVAQIMPAKNENATFLSKLLGKKNK